MRSLAEQNIMLMSLTQSVDWSAVLRFVLINFVIMIFVLWCYGAIFWQYKRSLSDMPPNIFRASLHGLVQLPSLFAVFILYIFMFFFGLVFLVIPGVILGVTCICALAIVGGGVKNPIAALIQSYRLSWPHWWQVFVIAILPLLALLVVGYLGNEVTQHALHESQVTFNAVLFIRIVGSAILGTLFTPWYFAILTLLLHDLQLRASN
jgi:hypothetical protein